MDQRKRQPDEAFQAVGRPHAEALLFRVGHRFQMKILLHKPVPRTLGS
jgi:hypothetical protein